MDKYTCYYYQTSRGDEPAKQFIDNLDSSSQRKFFVKRSWLEQYGSRLPKPHAEFIGSHIYELKFKGAGGAIRVLYFFFQGNNVIFTNGFKKKTRKTPKREKELAVKRREIFLDREKSKID